MRSPFVVSASLFAVATIGFADLGQAARTKNTLRDFEGGVSERMIPRDRLIGIMDDPPTFPVGRTDCKIILEISRGKTDAVERKLQKREPGAISPQVRSMKMRCPGEPN